MLEKNKLIIFAIITILFYISFIYSDIEFLITDFNGNTDLAKKIQYGSWVSDSSDKNQYCREKLISKNDGDNKSLQIEYDVESNKPAYNGIWIKLNDLDVSRYDKISISIKGDKEFGYPNRIKVELKNKSQTGNYFLKDISGEWNVHNIHLKEFKGINTFGELKELVFVFDSVITIPKKGRIYIDNIKFIKKSTIIKSETIIADFNHKPGVTNLNTEYGIWQSEIKQKNYCRYSLHKNKNNTPTGNSLKIEYNVVSDGHVYNGLWMDLNKYSINENKIFSIFIKGSKDDEYPENITLEFKGNDKKCKHIIKGITDKWQEFRFYFNEIECMEKNDILDKLIFIFDSTKTLPNKGVLYFDDIKLFEPYSTQYLKKETKNELLIADFNNRNLITNIGTPYGTWGATPVQYSQYTKIWFNNTFKNRSKDSVLVVDYDVDAEEPAYNGIWMKLGDLDVSKYNHISMEIKGNPKKGYCSDMAIEIKSSESTGKGRMEGITENWKTITLAFKDLIGLSEFNKLTELVIIFNDKGTNPKKGMLYIDNVKFLYKDE